MREIVHIQAGQCGNQIGAKVSVLFFVFLVFVILLLTVNGYQISHLDSLASNLFLTRIYLKSVLFRGPRS